MQAFPSERRIVLLDYGAIALAADAWNDMEIYGRHMETAVDSILYIETDIPRGMTFSEWKRSKAQQPSRRHFLARLRARRAAKSR